MTDTQERVEINQIPTGQRFGFLRRLVNRCIASECSFYKTIAAVVVVGAALYHHQAINSMTGRKNAWTVSTSRCPIQSLRKLF